MEYYSSSSSLPAWAIALIASGSAVIVASIAIAVTLIIRKKKRLVN